MYRRLEDDDKKAQMAEESPQEVCPCSCRKEEVPGDESPEVDTALVHLSVDFDING